MKPTIVSEKVFRLHAMDHNKSGYKVVVTLSEHKMTIRNRLESCGLIQEIASCSCGFASTEHPGGGCWQQGHNKAKSHHKMTDIHKNMYQSAMKVTAV